MFSALHYIWVGCVILLPVGCKRAVEHPSQSEEWYYPRRVNR